MRPGRIPALALCAAFFLTAAGFADEPPLSDGPNYNTTSGPSGSGCRPGNTRTVPEGWWAGVITSSSGTNAHFDVVCWYQGDAATKRASRDGETATDDYFVGNKSRRLRNVDFGSLDTPATCVGQDTQPFACTVGDVLKLYPGIGKTVDAGGKQAYGFRYVWIHGTGDGKADYAYVQYTP